MLKLMKLELRKDNFRKYFLGVIISLLCTVGLLAMMVYVKDNGQAIFTSENQIFQMGDVVIRAIYIIFAGVLIANIIIAEFKNETIKNLFVYPIARKKIMTCKLLLIFAFTFIAYTVSAVLVDLMMLVINAFIPMIPGVQMTLLDVITRIPTVIIGALMTAGLSLIALYFGLRKRSTVTTIVSSVIITMILSNSTGNSVNNNLFSVTGIPLILCLIGIGVAILSFRNINQADIN